MTPQPDLDSLNYDRQIVNAQIRESIAALLIQKEHLNPDEEHLRDFLDLTIDYFKSKIDLLNEEAAKANRRLKNVSPFGRN
jgi:hypothetical protein